MKHDNTCLPSSPGCSHRASIGNGLRGIARQPISDVDLWRQDPVVLLQLRKGQRSAEMHQDVRIAAVRKPLVGCFLSQEGSKPDATRGAAIEFRFAQNESQGNSEPVGSVFLPISFHFQNAHYDACRASRNVAEVSTEDRFLTRRAGSE